MSLKKGKWNLWILCAVAAAFLLGAGFAGAGGGAWAAPQPSYVEGEALVVLRNLSVQRGVSAQSLTRGGEAYSYTRSVAARAGASAEETYDALSIQAGKIFALVKSNTKTTMELIAELKQNPNVLKASPSYIRHLAANQPNDPRYPDDLWGLIRIRADKVWDAYVTGSDQVYVAVGDSGIDLNHEDLQANIAAAYCVDFSGSPSGVQDGDTHGSHVAGTIAAVGNNGKGVVGVTWNTKIIAYKIFRDNGGYVGNGEVKAINALIGLLQDNPTMKIPAINFSLGGWYPDSPESYVENDCTWEMYKTLSDMNRTLIVVAAGNEAREVGVPNIHDYIQQIDDLGDGPIPIGYYAYPASYIGIPNMIVVAAIGETDNAAVFTNWSETAVDIAAPGVGIWSTVPGNQYAEKQGTSMAAPHVSGAIALLASKFPALAASQLKAYLLNNTANPAVNPVLNMWRMPSRPNYNISDQKISRHGLLDVKAAYDALNANPTWIASVTINESGPFDLESNGNSARKTVQLTADKSPPSPTIDKVLWETSNPLVATVDETGMVTAVGSGTATISAVAGDGAVDGSGNRISDSIVVNVVTYAETLAVVPPSVNLAPGGTTTLAVNVAPSDTTNKAVDWASDNADITVSSTGVVTVAQGAAIGDTATITATAQGSYHLDDVKATATVTVVSPGGGGGSGGGGGGSTPAAYAKSPDVRSVTVVIDGKTYEGTIEGDRITIDVPAGTDISKLNLIVSGYPGAKVSPAPPYDFSNGPVKITVTSPDGSTKKEYTITVNVADLQPVVTSILNALAANCTAKLTQNADGTWGVEILIPFASGFTPAEIETIAAALSGLSNVRFYYVDENGAVTEISTRKAGEKYLRITGTAANRAALSNVVLSSVSVWKKNDATEYKQSMSLKLSDIPGGKPAEETPVPSTGGSSSGCDAGLFGGLLLLSLLPLLRKRDN